MRARLLGAAWGLLITRAGLRVAGFRRWKTAIEQLTRRAMIAGGSDPQGELQLASAMERSIAAVARHLPFETSCLDQSFTLWWYLRRRGFAAKLCLGGRKGARGFEAHAWVEFAGATFVDASGESVDFVEFERTNAAIERRVL